MIGSKGCGANMRVTPVGLLPGIDRRHPGRPGPAPGRDHPRPSHRPGRRRTHGVRGVGAAGRRDPGRTPAQLRARAYDQRTVYRGDWLGDLWRHWYHRRRPRTTSPRAGTSASRALDRLEAALPRPDRTADPCRPPGPAGSPRRPWPRPCCAPSCSPTSRSPALGRAAATSGDSDSIACLAGAFLGAAHGMAAWPEAWADPDRVRRPTPFPLPRPHGLIECFRGSGRTAEVLSLAAAMDGKIAAAVLSEREES